MTGLPDPILSRAVLIGVGRYRTLDRLSAVHNNLTALAVALRSDRVWGLPSANCVAIEDPAATASMLDPVVEAGQNATDTLLLYYAGHGLVDRRGELHLALVDSDPQRIYTAVPYGHIRDILLESRAARRIVILDCCYSGRALGQMASSVSGVVDEASAEGTYVLAAAAENKAALAPPGERYTAFTGELLDIFHNGITGCGALLDLDAIYQHLRTVMNGKGLPVPQKRDRNTAGQLALIRNRAHSLPSLVLVDCDSLEFSLQNWSGFDDYWPESELFHKRIHELFSSLSGLGHVYTSGGSSDLQEITRRTGVNSWGGIFGLDVREMSLDELASFRELVILSHSGEHIPLIDHVHAAGIRATVVCIPDMLNRELATAADSVKNLLDFLPAGDLLRHSETRRSYLPARALPVKEILSKAALQSGMSALTLRQREILTFDRRGVTFLRDRNRELGINRSSQTAHMRHIRARLGLRADSEVRAWAREHLSRPAGTLSTLRPREFEVVSLMAEGFGYAAIANKLAISPATAARDVRRVLIKLGLYSRSEVHAWATENLRSDGGSAIPPRLGVIAAQIYSDDLDERMAGINSLRLELEGQTGFHWTLVTLLEEFIRSRTRLKGNQFNSDGESRPLISMPSDVLAALHAVVYRARVWEPRGLDLSHLDLRGAMAPRAWLPRANLTGSLLQDVELLESHLEDADLTRARLQRANLRRAHLSGAHLQDTRLQYARLTRADLRRAVLVRASLQHARLDAAQVAEADFREAKLGGADLISTIGLTPSQVQNADSEGANLPDSFR